jgi:methyltransferase
VGSLGLYWTFVAAVGVERLVELTVSRRNANWSLERGGLEYGREHYPVMVVLHLGLLAGCIAEPALCGRLFRPWLGWPMLAVALVCQGMRWWCVTSLGRRWNTRIIVVPELPLVTDGPYRWLRHPNYAAVAVEGIALPLIHSAWITAVVFTFVNGILLRHRVRVEEHALRTSTSTSAAYASVGGAG